MILEEIIRLKKLIVTILLHFLWWHSKNCVSGKAELYIILALLIGMATVIVGCWLSDNCWSPEPEQHYTIAWHDRHRWIWARPRLSFRAAHSNNTIILIMDKHFDLHIFNLALHYNTRRVESSTEDTIKP